MCVTKVSIVTIVFCGSKRFRRTARGPTQPSSVPTPSSYDHESIHFVDVVPGGGATSRGLYMFTSSRTGPPCSFE